MHDMHNRKYYMHQTARNLKSNTSSTTNNTSKRVFKYMPNMAASTRGIHEHLHMHPCQHIHGSMKTDDNIEVLNSNNSAQLTQLKQQCSANTTQTTIHIIENDIRFWSCLHALFLANLTCPRSFESACITHGTQVS